MKTLIVLIFILFGFSQCGETEMVSPNDDINVASTFAISNGSKSGNLATRSSCFLTSNFTARLYTTSGVRILPENVQPNTNYVVRVRITGSYVCCENPAYCIQGFGFSLVSGNPKDSSSGDVDFTIKTNAVLIPDLGIFGYAQAIGCNGTPSCGDMMATAISEIE